MHAALSGAIGPDSGALSGASGSIGVYCTDRSTILDVVMLSRLQFALTIMFHYIFPPLTIGLGVVLVYLEGMYLRTKDPLYESAARYWTKIFGLNFALGVVTG